MALRAAAAQRPGMHAWRMRHASSRRPAAVAAPPLLWLPLPPLLLLLHAHACAAAQRPLYACEKDAAAAVECSQHELGTFGSERAAVRRTVTVARTDPRVANPSRVPLVYASCGALLLLSCL